jgi:alkylation response protein AidB-like acyl-CoA dehydrogenase
MTNFYTDNEDLSFRLEHADLGRVVALREDGYDQARQFPFAPNDLDDARDSFGRALTIAGEIAGEFVAPRSEDVDREGSVLADGEVCYARGIGESLVRLRQADLMGMTLPRRFGGLNFPVTVSMMVVEMISRADPSLMNIFGLQDISDTISKFASEELKQEFLPRFASGEITGSMALTEPEAGSDLQNIQLKATEQADGWWRLDGVKRFITNGCGTVSLVLARSEVGTTDARGLSLFVYERDEHMKIRRLEDKLGIHGSPTCELQFDAAPARLVGERRRGLTTYVMSLMNGARLAIAAQAQGIAEAAYRAAEKYAGERVQFGRPIRELTAVAAILADMRVSIEASRALLYETCLIVDLKDALEHRMAQLETKKAGGAAAAGETKEAAAVDDQTGAAAADAAAAAELKELRGEHKKVTRLAALFTPLCKALATEMANQVAYDAIQVHGGSGYMRDFAVERHARDARITNIYEGTTQLQVVAAIGGVLGGTLSDRMTELDGRDYSATPELLAAVRAARVHLDEAIAYVREAGDERFRDFHARRLVEMGIDVVCGYLLTGDAQRDPRKLLVARHFVDAATARVAGAAGRILRSRPADLDELATLGRL